ncbi:SWIM zinc finger family protein [Hymenobacter latericus]|uniref:SWIM zinc finger family protein n=1 Tax=Hymenobacter sp. YIM 151858-1 TaxID=2987688 RepID=UPI00222769FC|nr:hypothetical protein [Hymenobacter sp. YIM 151858-1]UYZ60013.1 hypothetical protein OIS50_04255 [Hymenobacter sp. YIM 151858-1]
MWTEDQVRALITDPGTLKRGLDLAKPSQWNNLGKTNLAAWGACAGSGSKPYQVGIDLGEPAFKCSCPSRVFPCKHGAGLLLLLARQPQLFGESSAPAWLAEWLDKRQQTKISKSSPAEPNEVVVPTESADEKPRGVLQVSGQRLERMQRGAAELLTWLHDLMGAGLAQTEKQPASFWEHQAARLVDDKLPGLAAVLRELPTLRYSGTDWPERQLARLGELYLLTRAVLRLPELPTDLRHDVLQLIGVNAKKEDVLAQQVPVADTWLVVGQITTEEERLLARRTWLWAEQQARYALVLEYSFGGQAFASALVPHGRYQGGLAFYPGSVPLRAVPATDWIFIGLQPTPTLPPATSPTELLDAYASALGRLPWLREWPATLSGVVPVLMPDGSMQLHHTATGAQLPVRANADQSWALLAASGGHPLSVFGEWNGRALLPLGYTALTQPVGR